ncbi:acyl-CoA dehydrogenase [Sinimarinibacterium sp. CAU 1509]|uniref:acyl-CoA dehydrogenase family protein n=1 Tax=Sinimarinibacterium sp. CAU 1509 TaxID=2562283 RepID=UPI0010AD6566|nr:acyl-CoA dehydrogenase family protein [Sinimarinibacterium sp. CAU 1509]TJY60857.1 acyl-CoA dehydrogenase [Sinimarinibacterium sp. CAU 1509]
MTHRHPFHTEEHEAFRQQVRRFVAQEITPNVESWEHAGELPRELHRRASDAGLLQIGFPEDCGGVQVPDLFYLIAMTEELARAGSGGVIASLMSHGIGCPPIAHVGTAEQRQRFVAPVLAGERISALAITEPSGGSDVANLKTRAELDGDHYVVNGSKMFITSGMRADFITTAVRTGGPGMGGISLLVIEGDTPGLSRTPLKKMGWWSSDTAALYFDSCRVPVANRIGPENAGFIAIMMNFNQERIMLAAQASAFAQVCYDEALEYAKQRETFGKPLIRQQVIRHKLTDMRMRIEAVRANLDMLAWRVSQRQMPIAEVCLLKNFATTSLEWIANEAMQILGGAGYLQGSKVERIYRETKVLTIGGGSQEIMKELASRQLGY